MCNSCAQGCNVFFWLDCSQKNRWSITFTRALAKRTIVTKGARYITAQKWEINYFKIEIISFIIWASAWDLQQCDMCDQQSLRSACAYAQSDQRLCSSLEYSMSVKLLTEHLLEVLSLKGGCTCLSESTHVEMPHCWKSHVTAYIFQMTLAIISGHVQIQIGDFNIQRICFI